MGLSLAGCGGSEFSTAGSGGSGGGASGGGANGSGAASGAGAAAGTNGAAGGENPAGGALADAGSGIERDAGGGPGDGGPVSYPSAVCDVPTHQGSPIAAPSCGESAAECLIDWAGAFGEPGLEDGPREEARFVGLYGLSGDGTYVYASTAHSIRRISIATGEVSTLAGTGAPGYFDGQASEARFSCPRGLSVNSGYVYVADAGNDRVRRVDAATGEVSTVAAGREFSAPAHLHAGSNALFIVEPPENRMSAFHLTLENFTRFAANGGADGSADLSSPHGLAFVTEWSLFYIADSGNHVIRKIVEDWADPPQLGVIGAAGWLDGNGGDARFDTPRGMSVRQSPMTLYVADHGNHAIRRILPASGYAVTTMAGNGTAGHAVGAGVSARLTYPTDVHYDPGTSSLFVAEGTVVRRMTETLH